MRVRLSRLVAASSLLVIAPALAGTSEPPAPAGHESYNEVVESRIQPQAERLLLRLVKEGHALTMDGVPVFDGRDKFLPGKIAVGLVDFLLSVPKEDPRLPGYLQAFRRVAALTVDDTNDSWGAYYYILALNDLRKAGWLKAAVDPLTLAKLRVRLDWRMFVDADTYVLIDHPNNYYCVALGIARLRTQMGWEDGTASGKLFARIAAHYRQYSGDYGFADETDGEGRFDRYSVLLAGEVARHFIETDGKPPEEALAWLRKSAAVMLSRMHASGEGFEYGRSLGPYSETAIVEVLTAAAELDVLTAQEKALAYAYATRAAERYVGFWISGTTGAVNLWDNGRRTDAYRGKFRRFGENLSLAHQFAYTNAAWNRLGYRDKAPLVDFAQALEKLPQQTVTWFARGEYDRVLLTRRDRDHIIGLPLISGGISQHMHSPYFPIPFSRGMLAGVADGTRPLLLPQFTLADGAKVMPLAFFRAVSVTSRGHRTTVTYRQSELDRLGGGLPVVDDRMSGESPVADDRLAVATTYVFEPGRITRTDRYTPKGSVDIAGIELDFGSFSELTGSTARAARFSGGAIDEFKVTGIEGCQAAAIQDDPDFESDEGPMKSKVVCSGGARTVRKPFTIGWTITYH
jgi:hypothetical protein